MNKSIIISYKEDSLERKMNLNNLLLWLSYINDNVTEIIIVEQDCVSKLDWLNTINININHIFIKNDGIFNLGWGYNIGARHATSNILIFNSVDVIVKHNVYLNITSNLYGFDVIKPYTSTIRLDQIDTSDFIKQNFYINPNVKHVPMMNQTISNGVFIIMKDKFMMLKGFDEDCYGYGYDDNIFDEKMKHFNLKINYIKDISMHLYHNEDKQGLYYYFTIANKELYNEYLNLNNVELLDKINDVINWGDDSDTKTNEISIRYIKKEAYEKAISQILNKITDKFTDDYINDLVNEIGYSINNMISEKISDKLKTDLKDIKIGKNESLIKKILHKFKL